MACRTETRAIACLLLRRGSSICWVSFFPLFALLLGDDDRGGELSVREVTWQPRETGAPLYVETNGRCSVRRSLAAGWLAQTL